MKGFVYISKREHRQFCGELVELPETRLSDPANSLHSDQAQVIAKNDHINILVTAGVIAGVIILLIVSYFLMFRGPWCIFQGPGKSQSERHVVDWIC